MRKEIDWEAVEMQYRAGLRSLKDIGKEFGVSDAGIIKRAKARGWARDLSAKIKAKADTKVSELQVSAEVSAKRRATEAEVIEASAQAIVNVKLSHRKSIGRQRHLVETLLAELESQTAENDLFGQLGELMRSEDDKGVDKLNDLYKKIIAFPQRVDSMKKLAETLKHLIYLEREAFDITPAPTPTDNALSSIAKAIQGNTFLPVASPVESDADDEED